MTSPDGSLVMSYFGLGSIQLGMHPHAELAVGLLLVAAAAMVADFFVRQVLLRLLVNLLDHIKSKLGTFLGPVLRKLAMVVPALVVQIGVLYVPSDEAHLIRVIHNVASACTIIALVLAVSSALDICHELYSRSEKSRRRSIKGYLQVLRILIYAGAVVLVLSSLFDRSPWILLSGLGALAAVLMLVFKDTLLSLVASVQLNSNDMLRIGDWIEMPQFNADGDVIDIALHTVKVQNWDKTITTIPTWRMINESFKNWRGMQESGGRRIKRALVIDQSSVRFLTEQERNNLRRIMLIDEYLAEKSQELVAWNSKLIESGRDPVNARRPTNIGTFRVYVEHYLSSHSRINQNMTLLVRQNEPTEVGLPLEIYCFTDTVEWKAYEAIQSDIFDHLLAIMPEFGLRLAQQPTGGDVHAALKALIEHKSET